MMSSDLSTTGTRRPGKRRPEFQTTATDCGRCSKPFETTPRWRYFCGKCRKSRDVLKGLQVTYGLRMARTAKSNTT